jgi:hypothetical protein
MRRPSSVLRCKKFVRCVEGESDFDGDIDDEGDFVVVVKLTCSRNSDVWRRGGEGGLI